MNQTKKTSKLASSQANLQLNMPHSAYAQTAWADSMKLLHVTSTPALKILQWIIFPYLNPLCNEQNENKNHHNVNYLNFHVPLLSYLLSNIQSVFSSRG